MFDINDLKIYASYIYFQMAKSNVSLKTRKLTKRRHDKKHIRGGMFEKTRKRISSSLGFVGNIAKSKYAITMLLNPSNIDRLVLKNHYFSDFLDKDAIQTRLYPDVKIEYNADQKRFVYKENVSEVKESKTNAIKLYEIVKSSLGYVDDIIATKTKKENAEPTDECNSQVIVTSLLDIYFIKQALIYKQKQAKASKTEGSNEEKTEGSNDTASDTSITVEPSDIKLEDAVEKPEPPDYDSYIEKFNDFVKCVSIKEVGKYGSTNEYNVDIPDDKVFMGLDDIFNNDTSFENIIARGEEAQAYFDSVKKIKTSYQLLKIVDKFKSESDKQSGGDDPDCQKIQALKDRLNKLQQILESMRGDCAENSKPSEKVNATSTVSKANKVVDKNGDTVKATEDEDEIVDDDEVELEIDEEGEGDNKVENKENVEDDDGELEIDEEGEDDNKVKTDENVEDGKGVVADADNKNEGNDAPKPKTRTPITNESLKKIAPFIDQLKNLFPKTATKGGDDPSLKEKLGMKLGNYFGEIDAKIQDLSAYLDSVDYIRVDDSGLVDDETYANDKYKDNMLVKFDKKYHMFYRYLHIFKHQLKRVFWTGNPFSALGNVRYLIEQQNQMLLLNPPVLEKYRKNAFAFFKAIAVAKIFDSKSAAKLDEYTKMVMQDKQSKMEKEINDNIEKETNSNTSILDNSVIQPTVDDTELENDLGDTTISNTDFVKKARKIIELYNSFSSSDFSVLEGNNGKIHKEIQEMETEINSSEDSEKTKKLNILEKLKANAKTYYEKRVYELHADTKKNGTDGQDGGLVTFANPSTIRIYRKLKKYFDITEEGVTQINIKDSLFIPKYPKFAKTEAKYTLLMAISLLHAAKQSNLDEYWKYDVSSTMKDFNGIEITIDKKNKKIANVENTDTLAFVLKSDDLLYNLDLDKIDVPNENVKKFNTNLSKIGIKDLVDVLKTLIPNKPPPSNGTFRKSFSDSWNAARNKKKGGKNTRKNGGADNQTPPKKTMSERFTNFGKTLKNIGSKAVQAFDYVSDGMFYHNLDIIFKVGYQHMVKRIMNNMMISCKNNGNTDKDTTQTKVFMYGADTNATKDIELSETGITIGDLPTSDELINFLGSIITNASLMPGQICMGLLTEVLATVRVYSYHCYLSWYVCFCLYLYSGILDKSNCLKIQNIMSENIFGPVSGDYKYTLTELFHSATSTPAASCEEPLVASNDSNSQAQQETRETNLAVYKSNENARFNINNNYVGKILDIKKKHNIVDMKKIAYDVTTKIDNVDQETSTYNDTYVFKTKNLLSGTPRTDINYIKVVPDSKSTGKPYLANLQPLIKYKYVMHDNKFKTMDLANIHAELGQASIPNPTEVYGDVIKKHIANKYDISSISQETMYMYDGEVVGKLKYYIAYMDDNYNYVLGNVDKLEFEFKTITLGNYYSYDVFVKNKKGYPTNEKPTSSKDADADSDMVKPDKLPKRKSHPSDCIFYIMEATKVCPGPSDA
jgi:hypothetical protein